MHYKKKFAFKRIDIIFEVIKSINKVSWKQGWIEIIKEGRKSLSSIMPTYRGFFTQ